MLEEDIMKPMLPSEKYFGNLELVYAFYGAMLTGVTVSETGRIFICFPKWGDDVKFTVAEILRINCSLILIYKPIWLTPRISQ